MAGPLINPGRERSVREVDTGDAFHREMQRQIEKKGRPPRVQVVIQVRHEVESVTAYRARFAVVLARMERRGVPADERPELLTRAMNRGASREWTDVEVYWEGRYSPTAVKLPTGEELEAIEEAYGADEAQVRVRAAI